MAAISLCKRTVLLSSSTLWGSRPLLSRRAAAAAATVSYSGSHRRGLVSAKLVRFNGRKDVSIPFQARAISPPEYLKQTERIVNVTFPDSARIQYLGDDVWQARLMTITFFNFSATPFTDVRVVHDNGVLIIDSQRLILDVTGLPEQFRNMDLQLNLHGELRVFPRTIESSSSSSSSSTWDFGGWVNIGVAVNLPLPLSLIPSKLLTSVGDQVVDRVLAAMEGALLQGIINDYDAWCAAPAPTSSSSSEMSGSLRNL